MPKARGCGHQRIALGTSFRRWRDWPAWAAFVGKGWLSAVEPVFLLKFMPFCRIVLHLIQTLAYQQSSTHSYSREGCATELQRVHLPPEAGRTCPRAHFLPPLPLPVPPTGLPGCRILGCREFCQHGGYSGPLGCWARPRCRRSLWFRDPRGGRPRLYQPRAGPRFRLGTGGAGAAGGGEVPGPFWTLSLKEGLPPRRSRPRLLGAGVSSRCICSGPCFLF